MVRSNVPGRPVELLTVNRYSMVCPGAIVPVRFGKMVSGPTAVTSLALSLTVPSPREVALSTAVSRVVSEVPAGTNTL